MPIVHGHEHRTNQVKCVPVKNVKFALNELIKTESAMQCSRTQREVIYEKVILSTGTYLMIALPALFNTIQVEPKREVGER